LGVGGRKRNKSKEKAKKETKKESVDARAYRQKKTPPTSKRWMGKGLLRSRLVVS
jgi:hypothetical protein